MAENGCKWRGLPKEYGKWNSVYRRVNRWAKLGVLERLFYALAKEQIAKVGVKLLALDSTVHPDGMQSIGKTRGGWSTKLHVVSADDKVVKALKISSGREHDSRSGKELLKDKGAVILLR
jgi:transposase